jgi:hypothetical protein
MLPAPWIPVDVMATDGQDAAAAGENVRLRVRRRSGQTRPARLADEALRPLLPPQVDGATDPGAHRQPAGERFVMAVDTAIHHRAARLSSRLPQVLVRGIAARHVVAHQDRAIIV